MRRSKGISSLPWCPVLEDRKRRPPCNRRKGRTPSTHPRLPARKKGTGEENRGDYNKRPFSLNGALSEAVSGFAQLAIRRQSERNGMGIGNREKIAGFASGSDTGRVPRSRP